MATHEIFTKEDADKLIAKIQKVTKYDDFIPLEVITRKLYKKRSHEALRYYWVAVVRPVREALNELGFNYSLDDTHMLLKEAAKYYDEHLIGDVVFKKYKSISDAAGVPVPEFSEYVTKCQAWAAGLGIYLDTDERSC
jgi:hypothetical protein